MEPLNEQKLLEILTREHYITSEDARNAQYYVKNQRGTAREFLIDRNIITPELIGQAVAEQFSIPYLDLRSHPPAAELVQLIPEDVAKKLRVVVVTTDETSVTVATDSPGDSLKDPAFTSLFGWKKVKTLFSLTEDIDEALVRYQKPLATRFSEILKTKKPVAPELVALIFQDSVAIHSSDIHFETEKDRVSVRFRVDGVLRVAGALSPELYELVLNRIKVMARLRTDEHFSPQDGALQWKSETAAVDMRVSIVPTIEGENTVIRILNSYVESLALRELGLSEAGERILSDAIQKPFGMILITGPTGSGKTTTLYALLKILNRSDVNIMTIEDPVEYRITGINQIQVNPGTDLTFAKGLKSIIRQDPNIILVGEIRDKETAEIGVNAALTGQLLLSTFHANDAATAIPRLLDMEIEPFLLSSTLELVVAQRLVRKICESCRVSHTLTKEELARMPGTVRSYFENSSGSVYQGKGCEVCSYSGYKGRTAVFEMITMTPDLKELILTRPSGTKIRELANAHGFVSMFEDGIEKVKNGLTSVEELIRVAKAPAK